MRGKRVAFAGIGGGLAACCAGLLALALARSPRGNETAAAENATPPAGHPGDDLDAAPLDLEGAAVLRSALAAQLQAIDEPWEPKLLKGQPFFVSAAALDLAPLRAAGGRSAVPEPRVHALLLSAGCAGLAAARAWHVRRR